MRVALRGHARFIVTSETSKHRYFVWSPASVAPEHKLVVIPRSDDLTFGILSARLYALWAIKAGSRLGVGNDPVYTTSRCVEPFPFPTGLTPADTAHQTTEVIEGGASIPMRVLKLNDPLAQTCAYGAAITSGSICVVAEAAKRSCRITVPSPRPLRKMTLAPPI